MRLFPAFALSAALLCAGCTTPDGQIDPGATFALTAGLAALGGIAYLASQDGGREGHHGGEYYGSGRQGGGNWRRGGQRGWR